MTRHGRIWLMMVLPVAVVLLAVSVGWAAERFPPPDFTDHALPHTDVPEPSFRVTESFVPLNLFAALGLASLFAVVLRSRRWLLVLVVFTLAWFGFWRQGCVCSIGSIQNVTVAAFDSSYAIPWTIVAYFTLPILFALFFGRTFCAAVCPLGAVQELLVLRPVKVPAWLEAALGLLAYVYLGLAVLFAATGAAFVICRYDPFVALFRLSGSVNMLIVGACFLVIGLFVGRPYCRFLCPYGVLLRWASKVSLWHVKIPPKECIQCRLCEDACPYGAIRPPMVEQKPEDRAGSRRRLALAVALLPVAILVGAGLGRLLGEPMSQWHPTIRLAEEIYREEAAKQEYRQVTEQIEVLTQEAEDLNARDALQSATTNRIEDLHEQLAALDTILLGTDATNAFRNTGDSIEDLYHKAVAKWEEFRWAGMWFGVWLGLVVGGKLIHLQLRRRRTDYEPDRGSCVSCGRCFRYCPGELQRRGLIQNIAEPAKQTAGDEA